MRKSILFVYSKMIVGGSTTSLISLLNSIDYDHYDVDLLLYSNEGVLQNLINKNVNILPPASSSLEKYKKYIVPKNAYLFMKSRYFSKRYKSNLIKAQVMSKVEAKCCKPIKKEYDVAISFLEFWPCEYIIERVNAKRKIAWIHIDLKGAGIVPKLSKNSFKQLDNIVMVSHQCVKTFNELFPDFTRKTICIENILSKKTILEYSQKDKLDIEIDKKKLNFVTVCRIDFISKGIDRGINAFIKLKNESLLDNVNWYIIGDGIDRGKMELMVKEHDLVNHVHILGQKLNPYVYVKEMDIFLLPSRYEGKPMAVTEAQMLGVVPVVCNYASAVDQIENGVDGIIAENNDIDIYYSIKELITRKINLSNLKENLLKKDFSNEREIENFYNVVFDRKDE
ncbi:glycosyltransferase [Neobacillus sp. SAB-20_R2A]|uniref:glycosyltransferase n=1 Tax=Neobacillus sp. SAB-20_R2A TaxID=3120519 RepID=UPI003C6E092C